MRLGHHPPATISDIYLQCFPSKKRSQNPQMSATCTRCSLPTRREHRLLKASRLSFLLITKDLSSSGRSRWHRGAVPGKASLPGESSEVPVPKAFTSTKRKRAFACVCCPWHFSLESSPVCQHCRRTGLSSMANIILFMAWTWERWPGRGARIESSPGGGPQACLSLNGWP